MKLELQTRWLRCCLEFLPARTVLRRSRVLPSRLEGDLGRLLQRQIARRLRRGAPGEPA